MNNRIFLSGVVILFGLISCQDNLDTLQKQVGDSEVSSEYIVSQKEAKIIAATILLPNEDIYTKSSAEDKKIKSIKSIDRSAIEPFFHIINFEEGGYVIISGDKRVAPLMAYADEGVFPIDETEYPEGLCRWMDNVVDSISGLRARNAKPDKVTQVLWENWDSRIFTKGNQPPDGDPHATEMCQWGGNGYFFPNFEVITYGPYLSTKWNQDIGYNDALDYMGCVHPNRPNGKPPVGCGPIAAGQLMKYFGRPTSINWSAMPNASGSSATQQFLKNLGANLNATYMCSGTPVSASLIPTVLKNTYGYSFAQYKQYVFDDIYTYIMARRPVIMVFDDDLGQGSHAWICDGISFVYDAYCVGIGSNQYIFDKVLSRRYLSMNWGWVDASLNTFYAEGYFNARGYYLNSNPHIILVRP